MTLPLISPPQFAAAIVARQSGRALFGWWYYAHAEGASAMA